MERSPLQFSVGNFWELNSNSHSSTETNRSNVLTQWEEKMSNAMEFMPEKLILSIDPILFNQLYFFCSLSAFLVCYIPLQHSSISLSLVLHAAQVRPATKLQAGGCITCSPLSQRSIYLAGIKTLILQCRTSGSFILMAIRSVVTAVVPVVILFVVLCARKPGMLCIVQCKFCTAHIEQNLFPLRSVWQRD